MRYAALGVGKICDKTKCRVGRQKSSGCVMNVNAMQKNCRHPQTSAHANTAHYPPREDVRIEKRVAPMTTLRKVFYYAYLIHKPMVLGLKHILC